jgi:isopentenyl-diphosphate Delta-isomerase
MSKPASKQKESSRASARRKRDHVDIVLHKDVAFRAKTTGFEYVDLVHNALPELNFSEVDASTVFLDKKVSAPVLISCMTGGFMRGETINRSLAEVCEDMRIPMGLGSQRQVLEDRSRVKLFANVRRIAPTVPVLGNIGAAEVAKLRYDRYRLEDFHRLVDLVEADALVVHCNPLQELMQPEGNTDFRGVLEGIDRLVRELPCPIIVKEVGAGISRGVAERLISAGVTHIDIAGAGGTSWSGIEMLRRGDEHSANGFWDWGIPTCDALRAVAELRKTYASLRIIASGGINDGITAAKSIVLGGDMAGAARVFLGELSRGGKRALKKLVGRWIEDIRRGDVPDRIPNDCGT